MDIKKLFIAEEKIVGVAVSDSKISIAFLKQIRVKKGAEVVVEKFKELEMPQGIIQKGALKDKDGFIENFKKLLLEFYSSKRKIPRIIPAILSFPSYRSYFQLFDFPDRIAYDKLEEGMKLQVGFSLPLKAEDCYLDWELVDKEDKKTLLGLIRKELVNPYLDAFEKLPVLPIALEVFSLSLNRAASYINKEQETICLIFICPDFIEAAVSKKGAIRFTDSVYFDDGEKDKEKTIKDFIFRFINFFETDKIDKEGIKKIYLTGTSFHFQPSFIEELEQTLKKEIVLPEIPFQLKASPKSQEEYKDNGLLVVLGAALRGLIPRAKDTIISLLPVGTEQGYTKTQAMSLLDFVKNWALTISLFIIAVLGGTYFLVNQLNLSTERELLELGIRPETEELQQIRNLAAEFNKNIAFMAVLEKEQYNWSKILELLEKNKPAEIILTDVHAPSPLEEMVLKGRAEKREHLLGFRDNLSAAGLFKDINIPAKVLEEQENIFFTIRFKIK